MTDISGITGPSKTKYIIAVQDIIRACIPLVQFTEERAAKQKLAAQGIIILGTKAWQKTMDRIGYIDEYPEITVIEKVGWNADSFALPDGSVFPRSRSLNTPVAIDLAHGKCDQNGSMKAWRREVAAPLAEQLFATFLLISAFMPPLLSLSKRYGNIGFEIVGAKGTGKSTLQYLVASAYGDIRQSTRGHYWTTLDTTYNALEDTMRGHADMLIIMDEANLLAADAPPKLRSDLFKALAFKLGSGSIKGRYNQPLETDYRLGYIISTNEQLASVLAQDNESARAAADRLITLPIAPENEYGFLDMLPDGFASSSEFAQTLLGAAEENHGHAMPKFLEGLVTARLLDEGKLKRRIQRYLDEFRKNACVNMNDGSAVRVADAFGLVYAAGMLAQKYGALPKVLKPGPAALHCYKLHIAQAAKPQVSFAERLQILSENDQIVNLDSSDADDSNALGYLHKYNGKMELMITADKIDTSFPDWERIQGSKEVRALLRMDGKHMKAKRSIGGKNRVRVYCFKLA